jgi:lysozyme
MKASQHLKNLLEQWEGVRQQVYFDSGNESTIGIGHLLTRSEKTSGKITIAGNDVEIASWLSVAECHELLDQDLLIPERTVNNLVFTELNQNQFDALVSFTFNVGDTAFKNSTLLKQLNLGKYESVPEQLRRWNKCNGMVAQGLINRREKEIALWNMP